MKALYHGTSSVNLNSIKDIGLVPGHNRGGDAWAKAHHWSLADVKREPSVFVTESQKHAEDFARTAVEEVGGEPIVVTIEVSDAEFATNFEKDELDGHTEWRCPHVIEAKRVKKVLPVQPGPSVFTIDEEITKSIISRFASLYSMVAR